LKRHWRWILLGSAFCGFIALVASVFLPKVFRATTYILVSDSKIGPSSQYAMWQFAMLPTYVPFVDNDAIIDQAIKKFHLDQPPYDLNLDRFRRKDILDVRTPKSTRLLELNVEFPDARLAADLANYLAQSAVEFNDRVNDSDTVATQNFLRQQLQQATTRMADAAKRKLEVKEIAHIESREKELQILLAEKDQLSREVGQLRLAYAENQEKAKSLKQELSSEPRTLRLTKSMLNERFLEQANAKSAPEGFTPLSMTEETVNTARNEIQKGYVDASVGAAGELGGIKTATSRLQQIDQQLRQLLANITRFRSEIDAVDHDYALAQDAVESASRNYQNASVTVSSKNQDLKQLAPAMIPERPVRPKILLNTVLGIFLGLLVLSGLAMTIESFREMQSEPPHLVEEAVRIRVDRN
jgi:succinoglycan biosynthesis transport protein ExoP